MREEVDYRDSEKFRAELHRFIAHSLILPFGLDILNMLVFNKVFNLVFFSLELLLSTVGVLTLNNSYEIMRYRDIRYKRYE